MWIDLRMRFYIRVLKCALAYEECGCPDVTLCG